MEHTACQVPRGRALACYAGPVPDTRRHRGPHPRDPELFGAAATAVLQRASDELAWLLDRGYTLTASLKLVGDRHALVERQRRALSRATCGASAAAARRARQVQAPALSGQALWIDGLNVLTTVEVALSGGVVLLGRDGCARDIAGVHGTYRKVNETLPALEHIGETLAGWNVTRCEWLLDRPVSNSGRLRAAMEALAEERSYPWSVRLEPDPDRVLRHVDGVIATADSAVLDACGPWVNLARAVIEARVPAAFLVDLG